MTARPWSGEPTPSVDGQFSKPPEEYDIVSVGFARSLERRLRAAERRIEELLTCQQSSGCSGCDLDCEPGDDPVSRGMAHLAAAKQEDGE